MRTLTIATLLCFLLSGPLYGQSVLEEQAVAGAQRVSVFKLDAALPDIPFAAWFKQLVGPRAVVLWQLTECGDPIDAVDNGGQELPACVEANAILPDKRKVVVTIAVGAFKKGLTGNPVFYFAVIEQKDQLYLVHRLRDLPKMLLAPARPVAETMPRLVVPGTLVVLGTQVPWFSPGVGSNLVPGVSREDEAPPPPPQPKSVPKPASKPVSTDTNGEPKPAGAVLWGNAVTKVQPRYPVKAKRVNASGPVEVQILISEVGRVIEAAAISGHPLLRDAAVEAARQWVFKPATLNGVPVETQIVLTFVFKVPQ